MSNDIHQGIVFLHGDDVYFPFPLVAPSSPQKALCGNCLKSVGKVALMPLMKAVVATMTGKPADQVWLTPLAFAAPAVLPKSEVANVRFIDGYFLEIGFG